MSEIKVVKQVKEEFSKEVEQFAMEANCDYFDALQEIIERKNIEMEIVPKLITARLKELLEIEAKDRNLLIEKKAAKLID